MKRFYPVSPDRLRSDKWYLLLSHQGDHWYWVRWLSTDEEGVRFEEYERREPDLTVSCVSAVMSDSKRFLIRPDDFLGRVFLWTRMEEREHKRDIDPPPTTPPMETGDGGGWDTVR